MRTGLTSTSGTSSSSSSDRDHAAGPQQQSVGQRRLQATATRTATHRREPGLAASLVPHRPRHDGPLLAPGLLDTAHSRAPVIRAKLS